MRLFNPNPLYRPLPLDTRFFYYITIVLHARLGYLVWSENGRIAPGSIGLGTAPIGKMFKRNYNRNTPFGAAGF